MQKCTTDLPARSHFCSLYIYIIPIYILYIYNKYNPVKPRKIRQIHGKVISAFLHFPSYSASRNFYTPPSGTTPAASSSPTTCNPSNPSSANLIANSQPANRSLNSCLNSNQQLQHPAVSSRLPARPSACAREFRGLQPRKKSHFSALTNPSPWVMIDIDNRRGRGKTPAQGHRAQRGSRSRIRAERSTTQSGEAQTALRRE
jgi:hypothetical protein